MTSSGERKLIEGNDWNDTYWGVCDRVGQNKLGQILMRIRNELTPSGSETKVVNMNRTPYDVYIGRAGKGKDGYFGNPFRPGRRCSQCDDVHDKPGDTLPCFERYFHARLKVDEEFVRRVEELRGKTLGCFCKPKPCHGDVIVKHLEK